MLVTGEVSAAQTRICIDTAVKEAGTGLYNRFDTVRVFKRHCGAGNLYLRLGRKAYKSDDLDVVDIQDVQKEAAYNKRFNPPGSKLRMLPLHIGKKEY